MGQAARANVTIYTTAFCGYCVAAKRLLEKKGVSFQEIRCDDRADLREWLAAVSGQQTVPQIFINGAPIGGYDELAVLQKSGRLDSLIATPPSVDNPALRS